MAHALQEIADFIKRDDEHRGYVGAQMCPLVYTPTFVYFAQRTDETREIKIGVTRNVKRRLEQLRTQARGKLELLLHVHGDRVLGRFIHRKFKPLKVFGEWYRPGQEIFEYIDALRSSWTSEPAPFVGVPR